MAGAPSSVSTPRQWSAESRLADLSSLQATAMGLEQLSGRTALLGGRRCLAVARLPLPQEEEEEEDDGESRGGVEVLHSAALPLPGAGAGAGVAHRVAKISFNPSAHFSSSAAVVDGERVDLVQVTPAALVRTEGVRPHARHHS